MSSKGGSTVGRLHHNQQLTTIPPQRHTAHRGRIEFPLKSGNREDPSLFFSQFSHGKLNFDVHRFLFPIRPCDPLPGLMGVSIPVEFSSALQPPFGKRGHFHEFQSLSGFQVRCNCNRFTRGGKCITVSIPVGFSSALQPSSRHGWATSGNRFNPCRVFKCAATEGSLSQPAPTPAGFNPCRVFKCAATADSGESCPSNRAVSIPVGFSSALQLCKLDILNRQPRTFQSLSGFQVRCNYIGDGGKIRE